MTRKRNRPNPPRKRTSKPDTMGASRASVQTIGATTSLRRRQTPLKYEENSMADITASLVKALREKSGVGMMDCKRALQETNGDMEAAVDWLRTKGLAKAAKKADRVAAEGVVAVAVRPDGAGMTGAMIELNAETDFVARNDGFQALARMIAVTALDVEGGVEEIRQAKLDDGQSVADAVTHLVATIEENMVLRRCPIQGKDGRDRRLRPRRACRRRRMAGSVF